MPKVEFNIDSRVPPENVRRALLDFSPRRPEIWPGIYPPMYEVYEVGETHAVIREGSKPPAPQSGQRNTMTGRTPTPSSGQCGKATSAHPEATSVPGLRPMAVADRESTSSGTGTPPAWPGSLPRS